MMLIECEKLSKHLLLSFSFYSVPSLIKYSYKKVSRDNIEQDFYEF